MSWKSSLKKRIDEHKHCPVCGISIPLDKEFCSIECRDKYQGYDKKKKRGNIIQIVLIAAVMVIFLVVMPFLQR
ncbi:MAG: DUF2116 family Zn-ribbon domain-containing protein [Candidatus Lokiarchaeota archaeon]|nr:DUF2116 family Zn-ribbon domain-containing protein [Candidatus Lokiarchaeota archaeon]